MKHEFGSFGEFAGHLLELQVTEALALHKALDVVGRVVENTAQAEIGFYQEAVGSFEAWAPLADSTEQEKARLGFEPDAPLLRTGEMRDSIGHEVGALEVVIGSTADEMVYQELGTETIPPRAVLGPAAIHNHERIERILGGAAIAGLIGRDRIHQALGYDFETGI
ncbi:hypothetical protein ISN76_12900 [Dyella halodurans]|uniref:Phage virion morphogenesis protein n=1 Tax=Dyella halodurans TaxID=1920171 RepID=A0ABV9C0G7_9GAMM|nr:hypothetical protein [Dyella halodurans]